MVAGLVVGLFRFHHLKKDPEAVLAFLPDKSNVSLNNIHHVATRDGVKEWTLDAESVRYQKTKNKAILKGVSVTFFLKNGETVHLTGNDGVFFTDTKNMEISGSVFVRRGADELKTDKLSYNHEDRTVSTDRPITVVSDGVRLTGNNMAFSFANEQVEVWGDVEAFFENLTL
jgi:LPS export ABC transporter protein LptC